MQIIEKRSAPQWEMDVICTGNGNRGANEDNGFVPCGSHLRVNRDDLRYYWRTVYPIHKEVMFKCPVCSCVTDLTEDQRRLAPPGQTLQEYRRAWADERIHDGESEN